MNLTSLNDGTFALAHPLDAKNSQGNIALPSGENFLRADFTRAGPDLLIETPSGSQFVVVDYFLNASSPALVTLDGAVLSAKLVTTLAGPVAPGQVVQLGFGASDGAGAGQGGGLGAPIGQVNEAEGQVTVTHPDGTQETLLTGGAVFQGDVLQTATGASVSVIFVDDTVFSLAESGRMVLDEMVYDPGTQTGVFKAEVVQGVFSFVSGQVAKTSPDGMVVNTPTTTIGIRGSTVLGTAAAEGAESKVTLVPDVDGNVGEIVINTGGGSIVLNSAGATTTVTSANGAPSAVVVLSQAAIQKSFGATLTKLVKVVAQKAAADAGRAEAQAQAKGAEAKQADAEAKQAGEAAQKADEAAQQAEAEATQAEADADAAKAEADAAKAAAEASGDPEDIAKAAAAEAKAAEATAKAEAAKAQAEVQAAEAAKAQAEAQTKTAAAETKAAEAQVAVAQAAKAQQFNALAKSAEVTQTKAFETVQKAEAETAQKADTVDTKGASDTKNATDILDSGNTGDTIQLNVEEADALVLVGGVLDDILAIVIDDTLITLPETTLPPNTDDDNRTPVVVEEVVEKVIDDTPFTQWAIAAAASTEYNPSPDEWSADQAIGEPDTFEYGDFETAWTAEDYDDVSPDWLELTYETPVYATGLTIYESYNNGFVYQVDLIDTDGTYHTIWSGYDPSEQGDGNDGLGLESQFALVFEATSYLVEGVKIYTNNIYDFDEIDAVALHSGTLNVGESGYETLLSNSGDDTLDGGAGIDTLDYYSSSDAITIDLSIQDGTTAQAISASQGSDILLNFENVSGSFYADNITGNSADNVLYGREGADTIDGGEGNDILIGGSGDDTLTSGDGMDIFMYLSWDLGSGDLETGGFDTTDATIGDKIYFKMQDFTNLTVYGSLINNIWQTENVASSLDASNSIALVNMDGDYQIHIDFDGDTNADFTIDVADDVTHAVAAGINGYGTISFETGGVA